VGELLVRWRARLTERGTGFVQLHRSGRPPPDRRPHDVKRFGTHAHALVYRLSGGRILGRLGGQPVLLLQTVGRRTGQTRTTPVQYLPSDGAFVVVAANAGAIRPPAWYLNLCAAPDAAVRIGTKHIDVQAREIHDAEREAMWRELTTANRYLEPVARKAGRLLPVLVLAPIESPQTVARTVAPVPAGAG
jgi:deazaflavin-dependent oxidoreductase (nitroreductase family)